MESDTAQSSATDESASLLQNVAHTRNWKHNILYLVMVLHICELAVVYFIINEYIQDRLKNEAFPNGTLDSNFTGCLTPNHSSPDYIKYVKVQEETGRWTLYNGVTEYGLATITNMLLSSSTDRYGRKFLFTVSILGAILKVVLVGLVMVWSLPLEFIMAACAINGLTGSAFSFFSSSFMYFADITVTERDMMMAVTITESTILLVSLTGSLVSGIVVDTIGFMIPTFICIGLSILAVILTILVLPETLPKEKRLQNLKPLTIFTRTVAFYTSNEFKGQRMAYIFLILAFFFIQLVVNNRSAIETIYLLGMPFCWEPHQIGYFSSVKFAAQGLGGVLLLKLTQTFVSSDRLAVFSALASVGTLIQEGLARTSVSLYLVAIPSTVSFLCIPMIRGTMSTMTSADKQGSLFSSIATVEVASALVATLAENSIYSLTVAVSNSFVFYVMAAFSTICAIFLCFHILVKPRKDYEIIPGINDEAPPGTKGAVNTPPL